MQRWRATFAGGLFLGMALATMSLGCGDSGGEWPVDRTSGRHPADHAAGRGGERANRSQHQPGCAQHALIRRLTGR